jgi:Protein of unknown function (DUF4236)/Bacterial SH3 domain
MGYFRFRRSIGIFPGVRWNIGKKSTSVSFGPRGLKYTIGTQGSRTTVGIPGTGISYTQVHSSKPGSTTPPPPLPPASASMQNPAKRSRSKVFYALGLIVLAIWSLGKLSEQKAPKSSTATSSSPKQSIASYSPTAIPRALPVRPPVTDEPSYFTQTPTRSNSMPATSHPSATVTPAVAAATYRVVNIASRDFLNVRQGPGSSYPLVGRIRPNRRGIRLTPRKTANRSTMWQEISVGGYTGWVNVIYLKAESTAH